MTATEYNHNCSLLVTPVKSCDLGLLIVFHITEYIYLIWLNFAIQQRTALHTYVHI